MVCGVSWRVGGGGGWQVLSGTGGGGGCWWVLSGGGGGGGLLTSVVWNRWGGGSVVDECCLEWGVLLTSVVWNRWGGVLSGTGGGGGCCLERGVLLTSVVWNRWGWGGGGVVCKEWIELSILLTEGCVGSDGGLCRQWRLFIQLSGAALACPVSPQGSAESSSAGSDAQRPCPQPWNAQKVTVVSQCHLSLHWIYIIMYTVCVLKNTRPEYMPLLYAKLGSFEMQYQATLYTHSMNFVLFWGPLKNSRSSLAFLQSCCNMQCGGSWIQYLQTPKICFC